MDDLYNTLAWQWRVTSIALLLAVAVGIGIGALAVAMLRRRRPARHRAPDRDNGSLTAILDAIHEGERPPLSEATTVVLPTGRTVELGEYRLDPPSMLPGWQPVPSALREAYLTREDFR